MGFPQGANSGRLVFSNSFKLTSSWLVIKAVSIDLPQSAGIGLPLLGYYKSLLQRHVNLWLKVRRWLAEAVSCHFTCSCQSESPIHYLYWQKVPEHLSHHHKIPQQFLPSGSPNTHHCAARHELFKISRQQPLCIHHWPPATITLDLFEHPYCCITVITVSILKTNQHNCPV